MSKKQHIHLSGHTHRTLKTLAAMIAAARKERKMSQEELGRRLGVSRLTVGSIEKGSPTVAIGTVFEAAVTVGIPLLASDKRELDQLATSVAAIARVLPKTARGKKRRIEDDF
jgi:transcriptional regulator with XRE-family HTH domain